VLVKPDLIIIISATCMHLFLACGIPSKLTQAEKDLVVQAHNEWRQKEGADMFEMVRNK